MRAAVRRFRHGSVRGRAGEQGQQQHEGHVTLAPSATARLSYTRHGRSDGRTDGRTSARHGTVRHGAARRSAVWHGMAHRPSAKEYGIYRAENERYDPPRPRRRSRRDLFSSCPLRPSVVSSTNDRIAEIPLRPSLPSTISFFPSSSSPQVYHLFAVPLPKKKKKKKREERSFSPWRGRRCDGETSD